MLKIIKDMINRKQEFLESARLIYEDVMEEGLNDFIILGETSEEDIEEDSSDSEEIDVTDKEEDSSDMDLDTISLSDEEPEVPEEPMGMDDANSSEDDVLSTPLNDDLPMPIGRQTGEPLNDDIDDLMYVTINLQSNTMSDVLPVPPSNASEALNLDNIEMNVDSGFESANEDVKKLDEIETKTKKKTDDAWNTVKKTVNENDDKDESPKTESSWFEAISLDSSPIPTATPDAATPSAASGGTNDVTSAVLDKVNEMDSIDAPDTNLNVTPEMDMVTPANDMEEPSDKDTKDNSELLKKLSSITDNIEAAKRMIINNIQK